MNNEDKSKINYLKIVLLNKLFSKKINEYFTPLCLKCKHKHGIFHKCSICGHISKKLRKKCILEKKQNFKFLIYSIQNKIKELKNIKKLSGKKYKNKRHRNNQKLRNLRNKLFIFYIKYYLLNKRYNTISIPSLPTVTGPPPPPEFRHRFVFFGGVLKKSGGHFPPPMPYCCPPCRTGTERKPRKTEF